MNNHDLIKTLKHIPFDSLDDKLVYAWNNKIITSVYYSYTLDMYRTHSQKFFMLYTSSDAQTTEQIQKEFCEYIYNELTKPSPDNSNALYIHYINNNTQLRELLFEPHNLDNHSKERLENTLEFHILYRQRKDILNVSAVQ